MQLHQQICISVQIPKPDLPGVTAGIRRNATRSVSTDFEDEERNKALLQSIISRLCSGQQLISGRSIAELYAYLQNNGGSYNDLRILFQHNGITPRKDVEHSSTRNRHVFLDEYIQPLQLAELSDAEKLVRFIEQVIELPDEPGCANPDAQKLLASLQRDGWQVVGSRISLGAQTQASTQDDILTMPDNVERLLEVLIKGLPHAMPPLKHRRQNASCLQFDNEYDVQDLLHSLLTPWIKDIRREEYTPSYAGSSTRIDFVLPEHNSVIEVKHVRDSTHANKIGDELILDIAHYQTHPSCKQLWIVVHDPDRIIRNPGGLIADLESHSQSIEVRAFVV